jgi:glycosyltransferase involved in cell wall biosynthesis
MSDPMAVLLTVVMPAYNEEGAIEDAVREVREHVLHGLPGAELLVVDDGSRDRTGEILDRLAAEDPRVSVIHQRNGGHGRALRTGLDAARGEYVFLVDSDRQIPIEAFPPLWELARGRDGAFGIRTNRHDPRLRLMLTAVIRAALRSLFDAPLRDANVPFKILRRSAWLEARELIPEDTLAPSLFLAVFARRRGLDIAERDVPHRERETGVVSIRRWKLLKFCTRAFLQLLAFHRRLRRHLSGAHPDAAVSRSAAPGLGRAAGS